MSETRYADDWDHEGHWTGYEVNREGDAVRLIFSTEDSDDFISFEFSTADAVKVGLALAQAGQEAEE